MDKTIRILLACSIAILFPVLVYFASVTIYPKPAALNPAESPTYPVEPYCYTTNNNASIYNYNSRSYISNDCQKQAANYQQKQAEYKQKKAKFDNELKIYIKKQDKQRKVELIDRAVVSLVISILAICISFTFRDIKELAAGIVIGATLSIIIAISSIISYTGSASPDKVAITLIAASFGVLTGVLYFFDKAIPSTMGKPKSAYIPPAPPVLREPEPPKAPNPSSLPSTTPHLDT